MSGPKRIWIDAWGGNWSPRSGGTQEIEYIRADLVDPAAIREAALREAADAVMRQLGGPYESVEVRSVYADRILALIDNPSNPGG